MTADVVTATPQTPYRALVDELVSRNVSALPVVDDFRRVTGVVSGLARHLRGVVDVVSRLSYDIDDTDRDANRGLPFGVA